MYQNVSYSPLRKENEKRYSIAVIIVSFIVIGYTTYVLLAHLNKNKEIQSIIYEIEKSVPKQQPEYELLKETNIVEMAKNSNKLKDCFVKEELKNALKKVKSTDGASVSDETMRTIWRNMERPKILLQRSASHNDLRTNGNGTSNFVKIKTWAIANGAEAKRSCADDFFNVNDGTLTVKQPGRYFVTSQVVFKCGRTAKVGHHEHKVTYFDEDMGEVCPLMINAYQLCGSENPNHEVSRQGGVYELAEGSKLTVEVKMPHTSYIDHQHNGIQVDSTSLTLIYLAYDEDI